MKTVESEICENCENAVTIYFLKKWHECYAAALLNSQLICTLSSQKITFLNVCHDELNIYSKSECTDATSLLLCIFLCIKK